MCCMAVVYLHIFLFSFCRFIQVCSLAIINTICTICMYVLYGSCISAYFLIFFLQVYTSLLFSNNQYYMYYMYVCAVWQLYICILFSFCRFIQVCSLAIINTICTICMCCMAVVYLHIFLFSFCRFIQVCSSAIINTICTICMYVLYGSCISAYFLIFFLQVYTSLLFSNNQYYMYYMYVCAVWQLHICIFSYFLFAGLYKSALQQ